VYLYWSFFDVVSIRELFGMAGRPPSRFVGVDSGSGEGGFKGGSGGPQQLLKIYMFITIQTSAMCIQPTMNQGSVDVPGRFSYPSNPMSRPSRHTVVWADPREDKMINPASGLWSIFSSLGPTAGPGSPGNGHGSKNSAGCTKNQPRRPLISPMRWHFVFLGRTAKR
jgi:hypothetical protein